MGFVLILLVFLNNQAATWHFQHTGARGSLLYLNTYDQDRVDDWQQYDDGQLSARIADGALLVANAQVDRFAYSIARPHFGDFDLKVEVRAVSGPVDNGFGVIFRYVDAANFYMFLVSSDGYYQVTRVLNGDQVTLSAWIASDTVQSGLGVTNHLRVEARGSLFAFFINNQPVQVCVPDDPAGVSTYRAGECIQGSMRATLNDSSLSSGQIGVVVQTFSQPDVVAWFDNVVVFVPEAVS